MKRLDDTSLIQRTARDARIIAGVIEKIDDRAMAADGPVTPTLQEATQRELRQLYLAALRISKRWGMYKT